MTTYFVTFIHDGISHANLITANSPETVCAWYAEHNPGAEIIGCRAASSGDKRPGMPHEIISA